MTARLNVNIDHVATVRQARRAPEPSVVAAAMICDRQGRTVSPSTFVAIGGTFRTVICQSSAALSRPISTWRWPLLKRC